MTIRERLEAFWAGERPDQIPYTIYQWEWRHTCDDLAWQPLFDLGFGVTWHLPSVVAKRTNVEDVTTFRWDEGKIAARRTLRTPVGEIYETFIDGWRTKYLLETAEDYAVMTYVVRHTQVEPAYESFRAREQALPPFGAALVNMDRTPIQTILVDYAGVERFAYHLYDLKAEVMELYDALLDKFKRTVELVAGGPGRYVCVLENFTAEMLGKVRYRELLLPVYETYFPILQSAGKVVGTHFDGRLASCRDLIACSPIDVIESLTPPPDGNMTLAEARAVWQDKRFWSNINIGCYSLPPEDLKRVVCERVEQAAPDGRRLAFEVSEQFPENWRESIRTVLEALRDLRG